jgi:oligopeptide/dipeptide ABC transporter ATP-binding protein
MSAILEVTRLKKYFDTPKGKVHAVDDVSFAVEKGTTMGIVGESGCGKSTLGRTIVHLQDSTDGRILFNGEDVTNPDKKSLDRLRDHMQIIFQDPFSSLNPRLTVSQTIQEPLQMSGKRARGELADMTSELMERAGIEERLRLSYPRELDGGRRQRVGIARALALNPDFIVCDEPVSALDVSIQAQILNLLMDLQDTIGLTYMFITHDLSVVKHVSDSICVMYLGQLVETSAADALFEHTLHPYSKALLSAIPTIDIHHPKKRIVLEGEIASPIDPKPGCRFAARCPHAKPECGAPQQLREVVPRHFVACCRAEELNG